MKAVSISKLILKYTPLLLAVCLLMAVPTLGQVGGQYDLNWHTIDGGGGTSKGGPYTLTGTIGQPDAEYSDGGNYEVLGGFWVGGSICIVDFDDLARFCSQWLKVGSGLAADLDDSNDVDFLDYSIFANYWLGCCPPGWPLK